jgi:diguanylate cyclase (GGDEF)-like protein/PAS domain S-box-containing protein
MPRSTSPRRDQPARLEEGLMTRLQRLTASAESLLADLDKEHANELAWQKERELFRAMIDQVPDYLFVKDRDSRFVVANKAVAADLGLEPEALIGKTDLDLHPPVLASKFFADEQSVIARERPLLDIAEFVIQPSGRQKWLSTSKVPLRNSAGQVIGIVGISRDVTDRKRAEEQIQHMAHHDALTGLPNRVLLMDRLGQAIAKAERDGTAVSVIFVDLDKFKSVNDSFGHNAGDTLLKTAAERMIGAVRATDTVARLSGDEFIILLDEEARGSQSRTQSVIKRLQAAMLEPVVIDGQSVCVSCSIGIAFYPTDATSADTLLTNADLAMYQAKQRGRDSYEFYSASMNAVAQERRALEEGLRGAFARKEFAIVYQPQLDLASGRIRAVEALLRWNHPTLGLVMPAKFIPLAEETGVIVELGEWVLREACRQNAAWQEAGAGPIIVAVNVSARQFRERSFMSRVRAAIADSGLDPRYLEIELTESLLMQDMDQAVVTMNELEELGVMLSIDDFGTGYSSLSALKNFPVTHLKIDRSFIDNLARDQRDRSIARAVISMAKKLNMRVIAEGVENQEQLAFLKANRCDEVQGFLVSEPVSPDHIATMLRSNSQAQRP